MALCLRQIYPRLQASLEDWKKGGWGLHQTWREVSEMDLREEDIVSMEDFAVMTAMSFHPWKWNDDDETNLANCFENLLCVLKPVEEDLLPPEGQINLKVWETFASAKVQQRKFCIVAVFVVCLKFVSKGKGPSPDLLALRESNPMVVGIQRKFDGLLASFQQVRVLLERQALLTPELQTMMIEFEKRLSSCCQGMIPRILRKDRARWPDEEELVELTKRWSRLSAEASRIAAEVAKLPSIEVSIAEPIEVTSLDSWSIVPEKKVGLRAAEVASAASQRSVDSQASCLSGHGGPHCFLPSHLFKQYQSADVSPVALVSAQDLQKGSKICAADGNPVEVLKVEVQKTKKLFDLEIDHAMPFTTTANHRIMIPSDDDDATVKAIDLKLGSWVICSDRMAKKVVGKREYLVEEQDVLAITFHPDKAVACFFLQPQESVLLTKGVTPKPIRRGGMSGRGAAEEISSACTEGDYRD